MADIATNIKEVPVAAQTAKVPTVVVDDVHIVYKVHGAGAGKGSATSALSRLVSRKKSPSIREVHAVRGISFTAYKGEAIGLIGSNGSGKSTMLAAIAGLLPTERGGIYTNGQPSLLGVNAALMNDLTGERNVVLGCLAMGMTKEEVRSRYQEIVDFSGINDKGDFISLPMRTYSSGMGARLRVLHRGGQDPRRAADRRGAGHRRPGVPAAEQGRINQLRGAAGTVFLVSHDNNSIREVCERTIWIEHGELVMDGLTEDVVSAYERGERP